MSADDAALRDLEEIDETLNVRLGLGILGQFGLGFVQLLLQRGGFGFGGADKIVGHESAAKWQVDPMRFLSLADA